MMTIDVWVQTKVLFFGTDDDNTCMGADKSLARALDFITSFFSASYQVVYEYFC